MANILQITFWNGFSFKKIVLIKISQQIFNCNQAARWMVLSVCLSVCLSVSLSVTPFPLCSHHGIIMKFSGVITNDGSDVYAKDQGQRSKVKVTEVKTQLSRFRTLTPVWFHIWWWNDAQSFILFRRGALLIFKVICQISRSHSSKDCWFRPKLGVCRLYIQFEFTDGYEMMHKVWSSIEEVPFCFQGHPSNFKVTGLKKNDRFWPKLGFFGLLTPVSIHRWLWNDAQILK